MDPQHLARLDDEGSVLSSSTGAAGGSITTVSPETPEVPVSAPVHSSDQSGAGPGRRPRTSGRSGRAGGATIVLSPDELSDAWPLPVEPDGVVRSDAWLVPDVDAPQSASTWGIRQDGAGDDQS